MPAAPFGQHPTFGEYLQWAQNVEKCTVHVLRRSTLDGNLETRTMIEAPSGRYAIERGTEQNDRLSPTTVGRLDRRLGLKSPFPSVP
jgi:hypothetical protein